MIPLHFCHLSQKLGGNSKKAKVNRNDSVGKSCLTPKQTEYIFRKVRFRELN